MSELALVLYAIYLGLAFGLRTALQVRRTGSTGFVGLRGRPGSVEWLGGVTGAILASAGIAATLYAQIAMGTSWRIGVDADERTELVMDGPFALVRNPIFAAMLPTSLGLVLIVPNAAAVVGFLALIVALQVQTRAVEEPYLLATHRDAYADYAARVGRFIPGVGCLRGSAGT